MPIPNVECAAALNRCVIEDAMNSYKYRNKFFWASGAQVNDVPVILKEYNKKTYATFFVVAVIDTEKDRFRIADITTLS